MKKAIIILIIATIIFTLGCISSEEAYEGEKGILSPIAAQEISIQGYNLDQCRENDFACSYGCNIAIHNDPSHHIDKKTLECIDECMLKMHNYNSSSYNIVKGKGFENDEISYWQCAEQKEQPIECRPKMFSDAC